MTATASALHLVFRAGSQICALPLSEAVEILRPLPVEPLAGAPSFVRGLSIVRGTPVPVLDLAALLLGAPSSCTRFVMVRAGERRLALAVDAVLGIREFRDSVWSDLPPLLRDAGRDAVEAVGTLDRETIVALKTGTLVPDAVWDALASQETR